MGKEAPKAVAGFAAGQAEELKKQGNEDEAKKWDEGGVYRIAPHTAAGALARWAGAPAQQRQAAPPYFESL